MRYAWSSFAAIVGLYMLIFGVLIAVFSIEKFTYIVDIFFRYGISLPTLGKLYASMLPSAAEFLLPIAVTIGCYIVFLRKREAREFLALSAAGVGHRHMLVTAFGAGGLAFVLCLLLTGFVKPYATYSFRYNYAAARADALTKTIPTGQFYAHRDSVMYISGDGRGEDTLRVFQFDRRSLKRMVMSQCAVLRVVGQNVLANLCASHIFLLGIEPVRPTPASAATRQVDAADCRLCPNSDGNLDIVRISAGPTSMAFDMGQVLGPISGTRSGEKDMVHLLTIRDAAFASASDVRIAGGNVLLSLTCLLGVAAAMAAVAMTAGKTGPLALGGAVAIIVAAMAVAKSGILLTGPVVEPSYFIALVGSAIVVCVGSIGFVALIFNRRIMTPMFLHP